MAGKKSNKRAWAIQITSAIGEKCWLNYEHLRFATQTEAEEWIGEHVSEDHRPRAVRVG